MTEPKQPEVDKTATAVQPTETKPVETPPVPVTPPAPAVVAPVIPPIAPEFELPTGVTERTKEQFDKLTDSNTKLLEANQVLQSELTQKTQTEKQIAPLQKTAEQPDIAEYVSVDPVTQERYIDEPRLHDAIKQATDRAVQAEKQIQQYIGTQQKQEDAKQTVEAYAAYPTLDPENKETFDAELTRKTRAYLTDSMMNPREYGGRTLTFKEAADMASEKTVEGEPSPKTEVKKPVEQNDKPTQPETSSESTDVKEQGGVAAQGVPGSQAQAPQADEELADLQNRSRRGDMWAVAKRLTATDHTGTPTSSEELDKG